MLTHGFNRNMERAVLIAGDLDFRPIVEALIRAGIFVEIWYERTSSAKELPLAADYGWELPWNQLYTWSTDAFRAEHRVPESPRTVSDFPLLTQIKRGKFDGRDCELMQRGDFILRVQFSSGVNWFQHRDADVLERYFALMWKPIEWERR